MEIIKEQVNVEKLKELAEKTFGNLVKAVVDIEKKVMVVGGDLHADEEKMLLEQGSVQKNLWGINLYPEINDDNWIEFDSMINVRPLQNNRSRGVESVEIQREIIGIVNNLVKK